MTDTTLPVGIDQACFYTPHYYLDLQTLAQARGVDVNKYYHGLGQGQMAVPAPDEGVVTLAANAAVPMLNEENTANIGMLLFATESGIDQSKSAGIFVHHLLKLPSSCRVLELKQACYRATGGLQLALDYLRSNPNKKVLLIASDIARYGLNTTGESSQGAGAVAMLLSAKPRLVEIEPPSGIYTEDVMDFWRPNYREEALVEGRYSCDLYLKCLAKTWQLYHEASKRNLEDHQQFLYHIPFPRLAEKGHHKLLHINGQKPCKEAIHLQMQPSLAYSKTIGNCYTASLYLGLISLLENKSEDLSNQRIGFYSYGSGAVAEYFSGRIVENYQSVLHKDYHENLLESRKALTQHEYEDFYHFRYPTDGSRFIFPRHQTGKFRLAMLDQHKRIYETVQS